MQDKGSVGPDGKSHMYAEDVASVPLRTGTQQTEKTAARTDKHTFV